MKKQFLLLSLLCSLLFVFPASKMEAAMPKPDGNPLRTGIFLKNNTLRPRKVTLVAYAPLSSGKVVEEITLLPGQRVQREYVMLTKLYVADDEQLDRLEAGEEIDQEKPFLIVKGKHRDEVFKLYEEPERKPLFGRLR